MATTRTWSMNPTEAQRLGHDYVDLFINDWGDASQTSGTRYNTALGDLPIPSVAGIQIHPESDVDRVLVQTEVGQSNQLGGAGGNSSASPSTPLTVRTVEVSTEAPMIVAAPSVSSATIKELKLIAHPDTWWPLTYLPRGSAVPATFGPSPEWVSPLLGLRFFFRPNLCGPQGRPMFNYPTDRTNLGGDNGGGRGVVVLGGVTETLFAILPVHGRGGCRVSFRPTGTAQVALRVAVLDIDQTRGISIERNIATIAALAANNTQWVTFPPHADWVMLYYTLSAGAGSLNYHVRASDNPVGATVVGP